MKSGNTIRRDKVTRKRKITVLVLVLVVVCLGLMIWNHQQKKARQRSADKTGQLEMVQVVKQNIIDSIGVTGTIKSADAWDVSASAKDVKVLEVNAKVGDYVNQGDVIVVLDSTDLQISLDQAKNNQALSAYKESKSIETASQNYQEAVEDGTTDYNNAVEKEAKAKEALQEAEGDLSAASERLERREERLSQAKSEGDEDSIAEARASYTEAHQAYQAAADAEEKALENYENAVKELENAEKANNRNVDNAADQLEQAKTEHQYSNDSSQKTIENYEEQIASCTVTAPISGVITALNVDVGDTYMGEGNNLFSIADNEHFIVSANVDEYDISSISKDMEAAVIVEAIGEEELPAKVSFVSPTVTNSNTGSSSYAIEIALNDANTNLRIGMTAKASIVLDAAYDVLTVPYDCIETDKDGNSVVYIDQNGEKTAMEVEVGKQGDYYAEVSGDGLDENTFVYYSTPMVSVDENQNSSDNMLMMAPAGGPSGNGGPSDSGRPGGRGGNPGGSGGM